MSNIIMYINNVINKKIYSHKKPKDESITFWALREQIMIDKSRSLRRLYHKYKYVKIQKRYGSYIPLTAGFKSKPIFPHGLYGIFISQKANIGANCIIFHQVTIGSNTLPDSAGEGYPTLGDNVYVGCGAKVIGNVHVGNNVRIGANCVVTKDVPDNCTVISQPFRLITHKEEQNNVFITDL